MKPSEVAQAACDKLSFTDANTLALAKKLVDTDDTLMYELGEQSPIHPTILEALKPFGIK